MEDHFSHIIDSEIPKGSKVLYATLNWGLGHSSRSIPIIQYLVNNSYNVVIASDGEALDLLRQEFPTLPYYSLPPYNVDYAYKSMVLNLFRRSPQIVQSIRNEFSKTRELIKKENIDFIISDNRYGVRSDSVRSVFLCHQIGIQTNARLLNSTVRKIHTHFINKFNSCWIPDSSDNSLAGEISHHKGLKNYHYLGPLSRLTKVKKEIIYDIACILSGPEPQRSILEDDIIETLMDTSYKVCLVRGTKLKKSLQVNSQTTVHDLCDSKQIERIINSSNLIICRSGYSSVMDLVHMKQNAILIPTPGQTEQLYLAKHLEKNTLFKFCFQSQIQDKLMELINEFN